MSFEMELKAALEAVRQAAVACRSVQSSITTESLAKKDNSPVTVADYASQALVCRVLQQHFPQDPVIGEEGAAELRQPAGAEFLQRVVEECARAGVSGSPVEVCDWIDRGGASEYSPRFWTLDPIDGTRGYLSGTPTWGVLISVRDETGPIYGIIDQPYIQERFEGGFGRALVNGPMGQKALKTRAARNLSDAILFTTFPEVGSAEEGALFRRVSQNVRLTHLLHSARIH